MAAARAFILKAAWAFAFLGLALFLGRVFCGYICPMGATIDLWIGSAGKREHSKGKTALRAQADSEA